MRILFWRVTAGREQREEDAHTGRREGGAGEDKGPQAQPLKATGGDGLQGGLTVLTRAHRLPGSCRGWGGTEVPRQP